MNLKMERLHQAICMSLVNAVKHYQSFWNARRLTRETGMTYSQHEKDLADCHVDQSNQVSKLPHSASGSKEHKRYAHRGTQLTLDVSAKNLSTTPMCMPLNAANKITQIESEDNSHLASNGPLLRIHAPSGPYDLLLLQSLDLGCSCSDVCLMHSIL